MKWSLLVLSVILLAACSGGSSSPDTGQRVTGLAATGAAISGRIYLKDATGREIFTDTANGSYSFDVASLSPPYMLRASWSSGGIPNTLYSFATASGRANITPITNLVVATAAATDDLAAVYANPAGFASVAANVPQATADLRARLKPLLLKYAADVDPISTPFTADGTGMDKLLDDVGFSCASGTVVVENKADRAVLFTAPVAAINQGMSAQAWTKEHALVANDPDVAVGAAGRGLVAWAEKDGTRYSIKALWLEAAAPPVTVSNSGDASLPRVAVDPSGNAVVIWAQYEGGRNNIWVSRYLQDSGWSAPRQISPANPAADAGAPDIAVDAAGNAVAVWYQGNGTVNHFDVYSSRYSVVTDSWTAPQMLSDGSNSAYLCKIAINGSGEAIAEWVQQEGDGSVSNGPQDVYARTWSGSGGWGAATRLNSVAGSSWYVYAQTAVAVDESGNGTVLWVQQNGAGPLNIWAIRHDGNGWGVAAAISTGAIDNCYYPSVAADGKGGAVAAWEQQTGVGSFAAATRYSAAGGWAPATKISEDIGDVYDTHVAVDAAGNATAVWYQTGEDATTVRSARSPAGSGWGASLLIGTLADPGLSYPVPRVAANAAGQTVVIWGVDAM